MMRHKILIASLILFFVNVPAFANDVDEDTPQTIATLRGLKRVYVLVRVLDLSPVTLKQYGLTKEQVQTDTEIKLRTAGIRVIPTKEEFFKEPGNPCLQVLIQAKYKPGLKSFLVYVNVALFQLVRLAREPSVFDRPETWGKNRITLIGEEYVQNIQGITKEAVDRFINAYLTANPKK